jgi:hypothetical protein
MPRVAPITGKSDVSPEHAPIVDGVVEMFGNVRGPLQHPAPQPRLAERVLSS